MAQPVDRRTVEVDGVPLSYLAAGDPAAPPLILLHGTFWSRVWQPVLPTLGKIITAATRWTFRGSAAAGESSPSETQPSPPLPGRSSKRPTPWASIGSTSQPMTSAAVWPSSWLQRAAGSAKWC